MKIKQSVTLFAAVLLSTASAQAINWTGGGGNNLWSTAANWADGNMPDNNTESAAFVGAANVAINVDTNVTVQYYADGYGGAGYIHTIYGTGNLTIDRNQNGYLGVWNATGNAGGTLRLNGKITIDNSAGGATLVRNDNSSGNVTLFDTASTLTLNTSLQTADGAGGTIQFNGTLAASSANLIIGSDNVSFGEGHDSSSFGRDIVFYENAKLSIDGGTVLAANRKFQVNNSGSELELNAVNAINGANVVIAGSSDFLIDANANQNNIGVLRFDNGPVTLDLAAGVSEFAFADSSGQTWGSGTFVISNFTAGVVSFGTDAGGLTSGQLAVITAYDDQGVLVEGLVLDTSGSLVPEPATAGMLGLAGLLLFVLRRLRG